MPFRSGYRADPRPDFVGSPGMLFTLAAWGAVLAGAVWMFAFGMDSFARGHLHTDDAIAHARDLAGEGAVACGVAPRNQPGPALDCAQRSQHEGRRYWFLLSRYGHTFSLIGLAVNPNGKTYFIGYSAYGRDIASRPDSNLVTATCVGPRFVAEGDSPFSCARLRFY